MNKQKNLVENLFETQSKAMNNWVEATRKMQEAVMHGNAAEKSSDLYNEWLQNQLSIFKNITTESQQQNEEVPNSDFFGNWYTQQTKAIQEMTEKNMEWIQKSMNWNTTSNNSTEQFSKMTDSWKSMYNNWNGTMMSTYENLSKNMQGNISKDVFSNMFQSNKVYLNLFETFMPLMNAFQNQNHSAENLKKMMNPEFYKELTEKMFGSWFPKNDFSSFYQNYAKQLTEMSEKGFGSTKEMMESYQNFIKQMPSNANWNQFMNHTNPLVEMYEKTFAPYAKLMSPEQNNMGEKMVEMMETFSKYSIKQTQLQYLLYQTSQKSMETAVGNAYKNMSENKEVSNFNQFFNEWVSVTDKAFVELFGSDEFSALKSEVLSLSSHIKKEMEVSMEKSMEKMPFAFKSHLDELYKSIYDLKKMVKEMKKNLDLNVVEENIIEAEEAVVKPSAAKSRKK